jgi:hypothetical protein
LKTRNFGNTSVRTSDLTHQCHKNFMLHVFF